MGSNWVMTDSVGQFTTTNKFDDVSKIKPCTRFEKVEQESEIKLAGDDGLCKYSDKSQLRYIYLF